MNCLFCRIIAREIPAQIVYDDKSVVVFQDINAQAPVHLLIVPREHVDSISDTDVEFGPTVQQMFAVATQVAKNQGLKDYRLVINNGAEAGQSVFHLHLHLLGGRRMEWPPG